MRLRFHLARLLGVIILATLCANALSTPVKAQTAGEKLVVYSGRTENLIGPILKQFTEETGIQVEVRYGSTSEMVATILEEGKNSPADVFIAQDAGALGALTLEKRLRKLSDDILQRVPDRFRSEAGLWVGVSGRARVLVYNTNLVKPDALPKSMLDLTKPTWQGRIGWAPSNSSFQAHVTAMRVLLGEEATRQWLADMVANKTVMYDGNPAIVKAVANGEIAAGLVNHYYLMAYKQENPNTSAANYFFPSGDVGALINVAGAGVLDTSSKPGLAQRLVLYLLGDRSQRYFSDQTYEYPLVTTVEANKALQPLAKIESPKIDLSKLSDLKTTLDLLRDTRALP